MKRQQQRVLSHPQQQQHAQSEPAAPHEKYPAPALQAVLLDILDTPVSPELLPADENGQIIGADVTQNGVINYAVRELGLCTGITDAKYTSTTEVYPDSAKVADDDCNRAQVAAVRGALDFVLARLP